MGDSLIGRTFGEFIIKEKLSEGGFGTVYRAAQPILNREAVVKVIHKKYIHDRHYTERFLREARVASQLEHPYTASIYAFGVEPDGLLWISMEFVRGTPLNRLLKVQGPLPPERFVPLLEKICEVVHTAHESGIIHRDLKPANIMVISRAGRLLPKLLDFGIAKSLGAKRNGSNEQSGWDETGDEDLTPTKTSLRDSSKFNERESTSLTEKSDPAFSLRGLDAALYASLHSLSLQESMSRLNREGLSEEFLTMGVAGSPPYMAPEQWKDSSLVTAQTDIYALGVLSYEVLTGERPFHGDIETLRQNHESGQMPPLGPSFPAALDRVISKATAKRSEDRYSSAIEFARAFRAAAGMVEDHPVEQTPYLGLSTFEPKNASIFFGREKETENFLNHLRIQPLIFLVGRSGAGKSSFIQAGVVPRLADNCRVITVRPGPVPLSSLSTRLIKEGIGGSDLRAELASDSLVLGKVLRDEATRTNSQILLIVDQLEEIFTLCLDQSEREFYAASLEMAARTVDDPVRIIFTLRDDFLVRTRELPGLGEKLTQCLEMLPTPGLENLERILVEPAQRAGFEFEDEQLPLEMAKAVAGRQGALPLLAFSAAKLWEMRDRQSRLLRREDYERMGGVGGALAGHAEEMIKNMPRQEQRFVRETFRRLVTSEGTRTVLSRTELEQVLGDSNNARIVLEKLIAARLLSVFEGEGEVECIEVVHEALLTAWPRLVKWRQEDVEGSRLRDQLREAARQWEERGMPSGMLWRDEALTELQLWSSRYSGKLTDREGAFCNASFKEAAQGRLRRRLLLSAAITFLLFALTAAFWINREIQNQLLESYLEQGRQELLSGRAINASLYLNEVYKQGKDSPALRLLLAQSMRSVDAAQLASFEGHKGSVNRAAFSPDGRHVVTASDDFTAKVWEIASGGQLFSLVGHTDEVLGAAYSHDGALIATASRDHTARIWDAKTGRLIKTLEGNSALVRSVQFSFDDRFIVTAGQERTVKVWDVMSGRMLLTVDAGSTIIFATFSPDGTRIVTAGLDHIAKVWDAVSGKNLLNIEGHTDSVNSAVFSPDATKIVTASSDRTAKIWNAANGKLLASLEGHRGYLTYATFSPDGSLIVTSSGDKTIKLWNAANGKMLSSLEVHTGYVWSVDFNNNATQIVTASFDGTAKVWNTASIKPTDSYVERYDYAASQAEYSSDGTRICTAGGGNIVRVLDASTKKELLSFSIHNKNFKNITARFSPDGRRIVTTANFDLATGSMNIEGNSIDKTAKVWDAETGELLLTLAGHTADLTYAAFSPDNKRIVTTSLDGKAKVWDAATGRPLLTLIGHSGRVNSAEFSPDGRQIVTAGDDHMSKVWSVTNGGELRTLQGHTQAIIYARFSPDGRRIVTGSSDSTAKVWDAATGRMLFSLDGHVGDVRNCSFSSDGSLIATASGDSSVKVWSADNGKLLISLEGHTGWVNTVRFSPSNTQLITSGDDGTIRIWRLNIETRTPDEIARIIEQRVPFRFDRGQLIPELKNHKDTKDTKKE